MSTKKSNKASNGYSALIRDAFNADDTNKIIGLLDESGKSIDPSSAEWTNAFQDDNFKKEAFSTLFPEQGFPFSEISGEQLDLYVADQEELNISFNQNSSSESTLETAATTSVSDNDDSKNESSLGASSTLSELSSTKFKESSDINFGDLVYPIDGKYLESQDHIKFEMVEYEPKSGKLFSNKNENPTVANIIKSSIGTVRLPIPDGIQDSNQVAWNGDTLGPLAIMGLKGSDAIGGAIEASVKDGSFEPLKKLISKGTGALKEAFNDPTLGVILKNQLTAMAANALPGVSVDAASLLNRATGRIINQNLELLFSGQTLRTFSFAFMLLPRSKEEAIEVRKIIRFFKQGMTPKKSVIEGSGGLGDIASIDGGALFLKTPNVFKISYLNSESNVIKGLNKFKTCACQGVAVNYAPNGYSSYYLDSQPVMVTLSLNFQEVEPIFYDDYANFDEDDVGF